MGAVVHHTLRSFFGPAENANGVTATHDFINTRLAQFIENSVERDEVPVNVADYADPTHDSLRALFPAAVRTRGVLLVLGQASVV